MSFQHDQMAHVSTSRLIADVRAEPAIGFRQTA